MRGRFAFVLQLSFLSILQSISPAPAHADKVTGSGAEVIWSAPEEGAVLDLDSGTERPISLASPRQLPARGWLLATLRPGEIAWIHLDGDPEGKAVRFAFLGGNAEGTAALEAAPQQRGKGDFLITAPAAAGPQYRLGLSLRPDNKTPRAQIWIGSVKSPGFRWEMWEDLARRWSAKPGTPPPAPPDLTDEPVSDRLALIRDALAVAESESGRGAPSAVTALLRAEALLVNLPLREPSFPYFRRKELTADLAKARKAPVQKIEDQKMLEVSDAQPLRFTLQGPSFLRIESCTLFDKSAQHKAPPLRMLLRGDGRTVGLAVEEMLPIDPTEPGPDAVPRSSRRRILIAAAPGKHTYELTTRGGPAWVSVISHSRTIHAEQLASHAEDVPRLLERARSVLADDESRSLLAQLLDGEAAYLALDDARARDRFAAIWNNARSPRLRAFAMLRLAALASGDPNSTAGNESSLASALMLLENAQDEATARLRNMLVAEHLTRVVAESEPTEPPSKATLALLMQHRAALAYMPAYAGPLLRYLPGPRSLALPLLAEAQSRSPLDETLRHHLSREWYTGTRWAMLPALEMAGAQLVDLLAPPNRLTTCDEATNQGALAYAPLSEKDAELQVPEALAPPGSLHRFHLVSLHGNAPKLGWATVTLDGKESRVPLLFSRELLPFAMAAGHLAAREHDAAVEVAERVERVLGGEQLDDVAIAQAARAQGRGPADAVAARRARDDRGARGEVALAERLLVDDPVHAEVEHLGRLAARLARVGLERGERAHRVLALARAGAGRVGDRRRDEAHDQGEGQARAGHGAGTSGRARAIPAGAVHQAHPAVADLALDDGLADERARHQLAGRRRGRRAGVPGRAVRGGDRRAARSVHQLTAVARAARHRERGRLAAPHADPHRGQASMEVRGAGCRLAPARRCGVHPATRPHAAGRREKSL